jgi:hypothetical protein
MKTVIWTQFSQAVEKDFCITLPMEAGPTISQLITEIVDLQLECIIQKNMNKDE